MPLATAYSEVELATYQSDLIGAEMQATLGWTTPDADPGDYQRAVNAALRMAGLSDIADATDLDALEAAARVALWQAVMQRTAYLVNVSTDGQSINLAGIHDQAREQYKRARVDAMRAGVNYSVASTAITYTDAYSAFEDPTS